MDPERKRARKWINDIPEKETYFQLMERAKLTPIERDVCDLKYLKGHNLAFIGDTLGYSEEGITRIHRRALKKLVQLI